MVRRGTKTFEELTARESEILRLVALGFSNEDIVKELSLAQKTVENHLYHIYDKVNVSSRAQAVLYALRHGYATLPQIEEKSS